MRRVEQVEGFEPIIDAAFLTEPWHAPAFGERRVYISESGPFEGVAAKRAPGIRGGIGEASFIEVSVELLAFGAIRVEDGVSGADQVSACRAGSRHGVVRRIDRERPAGLQRRDPAQAPAAEDRGKLGRFMEAG